MITFWRISQDGFRNFLRNAWLSVAATAVMTVTLVLMTFSYISNSALSSTIKSVTDKIDVSVYLLSTTTQDQVNDFEHALLASPNVASVNYVTQAQAVANYREENKTKPELLKALDVAGSALPPSIQIKAKNTQRLDDIAAIVDQSKFKALQDPSAPPSYSGSRKTTIDRIVHFSNFFQRTSLLASIGFVVISILIIFNTIRMAIFTRREEIEIMKLVGATSWFIRGPFLIEASLYGLIAAALALLFCYGLLLGGASKLGSYIDISHTVAVFRHYPAVVVLAEIVAGILIGATSSLLAMARYLKL
ncbi:MAG TPA: permease-like cell division protein FtsX [Candidatus Saccharimonadales bacterium]|nr:permease-like cell division protein FtsX [Candidatus Saccharimonadales bacterium]